MLRILGQVSINGTKAAIERLSASGAIPAGIVLQTGLKRRVSEADSWSYASPLFRFRSIETLNDEVREFISSHARLGEVLAESREGVQHAFFTLCPVEQSYEEEFACALSTDTVRAIADLGLGFQIAPAAVMPEAPYWREQT